MKKAFLILEDGTQFTGSLFGAEKEVTGEIVFTTAMTGYLETLTDPSYYGQIVLQTFPLIGNYGVIPEDFESPRISLFGYIVKYPCHIPSNFRSRSNLDSLLKERGIPGLCGIDTRQLTRIIRTRGVLNGKLCLREPRDSDREEARSYRVVNPVREVSALNRRTGPLMKADGAGGAPLVALVDYGAKGGIESALLRRNCRVLSFHSQEKAEAILHEKPDGIVLSNGPGDPSDPGNRDIIATLKDLDKTGIPIMGICLGHQLLALARGYGTKKMKFGHRGANQAVKDLATGRVYITSQNHGYAVEAEPGSGHVSFVNINDGTNEGMDYGPSFSVQFHPEAQGGPLDTSFLFDRFIERMESHAS
ncbi:MAG: carbamoyl phosphate synthase small subunit [Treponema sp.]|nr:carbamoyl phosphate synthase small subunit [Treponema sp.]